MFLSIVQYLSWVAPFLYFACFIPQIVLNHKTKSTKGWNDWFLLSFLHAYVFLLLYLFLLNLPMSYKAMALLEACLLASMVVQRFFFDGFKSNILFSLSCLFSVILYMAMFPLVFMYPEIIGKLCGWLIFIFFTLSPIPQIITIFKAKNARGFSSMFALTVLVAGIIETFVAITLNLPIQTKLMGLKNIFIYGCLFAQTIWYRRKNTKNLYKPAELHVFQEEASYSTTKEN